MGKLVFTENNCPKEGSDIYGLILTDHLISVDNNTVKFLTANSTNGCVQFMIRPHQKELVIRPIADPSIQAKNESDAYIYLLDHDGQAHLQEATTFIGHLQSLLGLTPGREYFFPGMFVESLNNTESPFIHFNLNDVIAFPLPSVNEHENAEIYAHRTAQRERHTWSDTQFIKRQMTPLL